MTNQQDQITLHHVNKYCGGPLAIRSIIYGCPDIRWNLVEDPDSWPITPGLIAWSYNREEVETLMLQLRPNTNLCTLETLPMTNQQHPITPPPELVEQWYCNTPLVNRGLTLATWAAQWGADQELEACVEWLGDAPVEYDNNSYLHPGSYLRDARRPKPPSLKEQALDAWDRLRNEAWCEEIDFDLDFVRRALEALPE